jgi:hypothetical protein
VSKERLECYDKEHFVEALAKLNKEYPTVFKWFVLEELRLTKPYSPFNRDDERNKYIEWSDNDLQFLNKKDTE